ncbi:hypothetical protein ABZ990_02570 [Streptomyces sp. NPDC046203]|uniref:hypothetical protein n=1 Tax=Streptomyces sp. NPDC046203 TaxID=3154602 RepID=UPI0033FA6DBC
MQARLLFARSAPAPTGIETGRGVIRAEAEAELGSMLGEFEKSTRILAPVAYTREALVAWTSTRAAGSERAISTASSCGTYRNRPETGSTSSWKRRRIMKAGGALQIDRDHFAETSPGTVVCVVCCMDGPVGLGDVVSAERSAEAWSARVEMMHHRLSATSRLDSPVSVMVEVVGEDCAELSDVDHLYTYAGV